MSTVLSPNPRTMMALASIAYDDMHSIPGKVSQLGLGLEVTWGPAELRHPLDLIPYSAAYVACGIDSGEYAVVIRGTDPASLSSWKGEDFEVTPPQLFSQFVADAPSGAVISQGTCNGLTDLLKLTDPKTGQGMVTYLQGVKPTTLYVTGHSLGGTLTPPLFAVLNSQLNGSGNATSMAPCSFAGLTPGNTTFNTYFNGLFDAGGAWRFYNTLDFAPLCWWSLPDIQDIYAQWGLKYGWPEKHLLDPLFAKAQKAGIAYEQPAGGYPLPGKFDTSILDRTWATQAIHQHHHTTYQTLVNAAFPNG